MEPSFRGGSGLLLTEAGKRERSPGQRAAERLRGGADLLLVESGDHRPGAVERPWSVDLDAFGGAPSRQSPPLSRVLPMS